MIVHELFYGYRIRKMEDTGKYASRGAPDTEATFILSSAQVCRTYFTKLSVALMSLLTTYNNPEFWRCHLKHDATGQIAR